MRQLVRLVGSGSEGALLEARGVLLGLLIELLFHAPAGQVDAVAQQSLASRIRRILDQASQLKESLSALPELLGGLGHSYEHLSRVFSSTYGIGPLKYMQALRVARAQVLLRATGLPAAAVGQQVGFAGHAYFIKVFRQHTGQTPGQYRGGHQERPEAG